MTARDEAIEAAAKAIEDEMQLAVDYPGPIDDFPRTLAVVALSAVPLLLNDLADRIEAEADTAFVGDTATVADAIRLVRAAAEGWGA